MQFPLPGAADESPARRSRQITEHAIRIGVEEWRRTLDPDDALREMPRRTDVATLADLAVIEIDERSPSVQLLVLGDSLVAEGGAARHAARLKHFDDRVGASRRRPSRNRGLEEILVPFPPRRR